MSKVPFFANFHNLVFSNPKFWHFLDWQKFPYPTIDLWYKRVGNPLKVPKHQFVPYQNVPYHQV